MPGCSLGPSPAGDTGDPTATTAIADAGTMTTGTLPTSTASTTATSTGEVMSPGTTTGATSTGDGEDSVNFTPSPDFSERDPRCDIGDQDCSEGLKCNPTAQAGESITNGVPICVPLVPGAKPPGSPCSVFGDWNDGTDDCELNAVCMFPDEQGEGTCRAICGVTDRPDQVCPPDLECFGRICESCYWGYCDASCDPRDLGACVAGDACVVSVPAWACLPDLSGDAGQVGDPCEFVGACDPGLACVNADRSPDCQGSFGCCSPLCSTDAPNTCPNAGQGEACVSWYADQEAPPQYATLGVCAVPP